MYEATHDHQLKNCVWTRKPSSHQGKGYVCLSRTRITETGIEMDDFRFACGFHSFSRYSPKVIYRGTSTIPAPRTTPVSPCKKTLPVFGGSKSLTEIILSYISAKPPPLVTTYTSAGVSTKSLRNNRRAQHTQTRSKKPTLSLNLLPQNIQPSPRSSYLAQEKKNTIDTLGCPKALAGNQAAGNRVL